MELILFSWKLVVTVIASRYFLIYLGSESTAQWPVTKRAPIQEENRHYIKIGINKSATMMMMMVV